MSAHRPSVQQLLIEGEDSGLSAQMLLSYALEDVKTTSPIAASSNLMTRSSRNRPSLMNFVQHYNACPMTFWPAL